MLLFSILVAGSFPLGAAAANDIPPIVLNAVRFAIAACVIGMAVALRGGIPREALSAPWRYGLLGGLFSSYFVLMFEGLKTATPVSAAAVFTLTPVLTAGFAWLLLGQVTTGRIWRALALGGIGSLWVIFRGDLNLLLGLDVGRGEVIYFVGCTAHALYTPLVRRLNRGESALVFTFGTLIGGTIVLAGLGLPAALHVSWMQLPSRVWIAIGYTALAASAATFVLLQFAALRLPASKVMAYTYLVPTWVIVWDVALGRPPVLGAALVGVVLTVCALLALLRD
ncbi:multidrug DMT transporter [Jannaschia pagri]|uniref:Multidrug DMT transporter n=1 Tax=Jannaschia pagri TaxID=2829797 RepID=A0ABQ4NKS4_9RHOB|nr:MULTISPECIES: DMT family transporter [unclassified Jannaschia]GIT91188.1 multidrug DMT transporter [Jannaschia sp. AI_61]GIT95020.1 multidrug DMT transporter [Jannaschia sp. AI_62]